MSNYIEYENLIAFHPSSYIIDIIEDLNITREEFASRLGVSSKVLSEFLNAKTNLTPELAYKIESLTGISYETWMNLQNKYEKKKLDIECQKKKDEKNIIDNIDIAYFKKHKLIEKKRYSHDQKEKVLKNLLNMADLTLLNKFNATVSYRNTSISDRKAIINSNIMLEIASNLSRNKTDTKLNKNKLKSILPEIKSMVLEEPDVFYPKLKQKLLDCGIILVALPHLKNSGLHGAIKKFKNGSIMLLITDRNKSSDIFWFSLMHEIFHIINGDFYTDIDNEDEYKEREAFADKCAEDFFIKEEDYNEFVSKNNFSEESILQFSKEMGIKPVILIGRLKKDGKLQYNSFSKYSEKYTIILNI